MEVLFLDQFSELGGAQKCLLDLLPEIERRGWRASAAVPGDGPLVKLLRARNIAVHKIPCGPYRSGSKSIADMLRFTRDVQRQVNLLRPLNFDLLYVNGPRLLAGAAIAYGDRRPVLFHAHSQIPTGLEGWLAGWSIRKMNATVVACARAVAPRVPSDKLRVIANGTPDLGFASVARMDGGSGLLDASVLRKGRWSSCAPQPCLRGNSRTHDSLFVAHRFLRKTIISGWWRNMPTYLPVDLLGWRDDIGTVLAELDLLVIASKAEGMPRVMLEAFSAGVPVVAFPVGGIPEVITDGETGFLVRGENARSAGRLHPRNYQPRPRTFEKSGR